MKKIFPLIFVFILCFFIGCNFTKEDIKYTVSYIYNDDNVIDVIVIEGEVLEIPKTPEEEGKIFLYWECNGEEYDFTQPVMSDLILTAVWDSTIQYTVTFMNQDKEYLKVKVNENGIIEKPTDPKKAGYLFLYWEFDGKEYDFSKPITNDIILVSKWEFVEYVIFDICLFDGEKEIYNFGIDAGGSLGELKYVKTYKEFHQFIGWFDENGTLIDENYIPEDNMNLYGKWEALGVICKIELDGIIYQELQGNEFTLPMLSNSNLDMIGWVNDKGYLVDKVFVVTENVKYTSAWKNKGQEDTTYKLKLEDLKEVSVNYKTEYRLPTANKLGYAFDCWTDGTYKYKPGYSVLIVGNLALTPVFVKLDNVSSNTTLDYSVANLDYFYGCIKFPLTNDISLPNVDEVTGATISWSSSNEEVITDSGSITRVMTEEHYSLAILTATITFDGNSIEKEYQFKVKRELKDISKGVVGGYFRVGGGIDEVELKTLDIVNGAFIYFTEGGKLTGQDNYAKAINMILPKAHANGVRVLMSIGAQSSGSSGPIVPIAQSPALRQVFANELLDFCIKYNLDGVDMDWERPSSSNAKNYTELMKVIYNTFKGYDEELLVTSAIGAGPWQYTSYDLRNSEKYHDYINMMSYDMQSSGRSTYHNALYPSSKGYCLNDDCTISESVKIYNSVGIPNEKIIIGIPFYGKQFNDSLGVGKSGTYTMSKSQSGIRAILYPGGVYKEGIEFWDDECKVPYIYDADSEIFITYDNPKSIGEKMKFANENGIAGVMYWAEDHDLNNLLLSAMYDNLHYLKDR